MTRKIIAGGRAAGTVEVPASKSLSNRYLNLALLSAGECRFRRCLDSGDTRALAEAISCCGGRVVWDDEGVRTSLATSGTPPLAPSGTETVIDCAASGTMLRFLVAALATRPGTWILDGRPRLRERPLADLLVALRTLGVEVECLGNDGHAPVRVTGGTLRGGEVAVNASQSSQFVSAILMAGLKAREPVIVHPVEMVSPSYVAVTAQAIADFGGRIEATEGSYVVSPQRLRGSALDVEGDYSSACYFATAAVLTGGSIELCALRPDSKQGDRRFLEILELVGGRCRWRGQRLEVSGTDRLTSVRADFTDMPDQVPTLAALAPFCRGQTLITGAAHLRHKESDRLAVSLGALKALGARGGEAPDGLTIEGVWGISSPPSDEVVVEPVDDHRIAMSFAVAGLRRPGTRIANPEVVSKSYPGFWDDFGRLCEGRRGMDL